LTKILYYSPDNPWAKREGWLVKFWGLM